MKHKVAAVLAAAALTLTACSGPAAEEGNDRSYDVSGVAQVDALAARVPADVRAKGTLIVATSADYAPAEFLADDVKTPIGYDIDLVKAIGRVLGLEVEVTNAQFASILPAIGSKYDLGISAFTIDADRLVSTNMVSYIVAGSSFAVQKGNPKKFDPDHVCGTKLGVLKGTVQNDEATELASACAKTGSPLEVLVYDNQADVTTNLVGGKVDAMYADSPVTGYAVKLTADAIEEVGGVRASAPQGIVIGKDDPELAALVQQATQHLMDDGTCGRIAASWGVQDAVLTTAELNPVVK